ncbi:MAG TPA: preprotein translocase subunit SecA [Vicinamibacterales bacterium]|jgi:preprotein translocase subunit SecA|nr:preprotein translocase subunit SecA [Vicinamibacterales bacterium]
MLEKTLAAIFGTENARELKRLRPVVAAINALESSTRSLTDEQLREKTAEFRERLAKGEKLDDVLPEAFAVVREAGRRTLNMRHFDVQLIGGMELHKGRIAEMKTGEGKTLVATLPAYLNALEGKGVHVVTVNDYLARRDSEWMGRIYRFLGMSVGVIQHDLNDAERQVAYGCDITYGTNNEFGFDYLRDNMKFDLAHYVQRGHNFAIVDEVDSILIDEARTPLIISGPAEESTDLYYEVDRLIPRLTPGATVQGDVKAEERDALELTGDYIVDEKHKTVSLTESGMAKAEKMMAHHLQPGSDGLYDPVNMRVLHHINQALRAHTLFHLDVEYMVKDGEVLIVDEFTGRLMPGRRWSDGLHQAVEAKEHNTNHPEVKIERENQTLATVTFQNYFRKYSKLSGMTGTADTEAQEFAEIYKLDVIIIPTNRVLQRVEEPDTVYRTEKEKFDAIVTDIIEKQTLGRPVLVGTVSIEKSEKLSRLLKLRGIKHVVLNAKYHAQEAEIVAQAGRKATVTIATNMAGRGTDILLGGNPEFMARQQTLADEIAEKLPKGQEKFVDDADFVYFFHLDNFYRVPRQQYEETFDRYKKQTDKEHDEVVALGGLHIIATERHEARRIDNQLRGRAGRQGDPGSSRFYLSLEDDLMRIFGSDRISGLMQRLGMEEGVPIEHRMVTKAIERAQKQVESNNFSIRKHLLEYDDVMNKQRESVYGLRRELLEGAINIDEGEPVDIRGYLLVLAEELAQSTVERYANEEDDPEEDWDLDALRTAVGEIFAFAPQELESLDFADKTTREITDAVWGLALNKYETKEKLIDEPAILHRVERDIMLQIVDAQWKDHLYSLDHLKEGIGLRGYGQRDPLVEYKKESFELFTAMKDRIEEEIVRYLWRLMPVVPEEGMPAVPAPVRPAPRKPSPVTLSGPGSQASASPFGAIRGSGSATAVAEPPKPGRTGGDDTVRQVKRDAPKVGRNDPCWCGSGKKFKKCHGA